MFDHGHDENQLNDLLAASSAAIETLNKMSDVELLQALDDCEDTMAYAINPAVRHEEDVKLPKQWQHWCKQAGLRVHGKRYSKSPDCWFYLKGHGRVWRVNCFNMLQCGDTYDEFDRWALCDIQEVPTPRSKQEFIEAVQELLKLHGDRR